MHCHILKAVAGLPLERVSRDQIKEQTKHNYILAITLEREIIIYFALSIYSQVLIIVRTQKCPW